MTTHCFIPVLGKRLRVTELDVCGVPQPTSGKYIATDGFITVTLSSEVEDGAEILVKKASGALCVNERMSSSFKRFNVEIEFCGVNPSLLSMVANATPYLDYAGDIAGFTVKEGDITGAFALELWTGLSGQACLAGQTGEASGYLLLPFVQKGVLGDITIDGENAVTFSLTGAATKGGNGWGVGPYPVVYNTGASVTEVQNIAITGVPTGGTFTLSFAGQTTAAIPYNATSAQVQSALRALSNVPDTDLTVTGGPGPATPYVITFTGSLAGRNVAQITASHAFTGGASPAINVSTTTQGAPSASKLPVALDPYDHLLMIDTAVTPPPVACDPVAIPSTFAIVPDESWTVAQIDAWAAENDVDLTGASTKAEKLARIASLALV